MPDMSRAILKVTEGDRMREIENAWFRKVRDCSDSETTKLPSTQTNLSVDSFWVLFLITGVVSLFSCAVYMGKFLYDERRLWRDESAPIWGRIWGLVGKFKQRDARAHPLRRRLFINGVRVQPDQAVVVGDHHRPGAD